MVTHIILGKERHDVGRENDKGYPVRSILKNNYFYSINFEPNRWPAGNPETGYLNTDGSLLSSGYTCPLTLGKGIPLSEVTTIIVFSSKSLISNSFIIRSK